MRSLHSSRNNHRGLTLTDVCVVLAALLLLIAVIPAIRHNADDAANKTKCAAQLRQIFKAMQVYANAEGNGNFPRTYFARRGNTPEGPLHEYTGVNAPTTFNAPDSPQNDVTGSIYLLMRATGTPPEIFICPASGAKPFAEKVATHSNFPSSENLSYSMQNPFPSHDAVTQNFMWNFSAFSTPNPLFCDMNPGGENLTKITPQAGAAEGNSKNHGGTGQNVVYGDGAVTWQTTPFCGPERDGPPKAHDNIFTAQTAPQKIDEYPQDGLDAVMLPTAATPKAGAASGK